MDTSPYHLILLCKNETGYQNLIKMVSAGFVEAFTPSRASTAHCLNRSRGLICLSACLAGEIPRCCAGRLCVCEGNGVWYRDLFGADNYY
ncbi:MAG: PHP domain-containing protein [Merdibacter sp.]